MKMLINVEKNSIRRVLEVIKQYKLLVKSCYHLLIRRFQLIKVGNARILMGDSLAGSIALLTALTYPTIFSQVAMLSPHSDETVIDKFNKCIQYSELSIWHAIGLEEEDFALPTTGERANF